MTESPALPLKEIKFPIQSQPTLSCCLLNIGVVDEKNISFSIPFGEGDAVSKKLASHNFRPVGSELRTRLRD